MGEIVTIPIPTPPFVLCGHCNGYHSKHGVGLCYWIEFYSKQEQP